MSLPPGFPIRSVPGGGPSERTPPTARVRITHASSSITDIETGPADRAHTDNTAASLEPEHVLVHPQALLARPFARMKKKKKNRCAPSILTYADPHFTVRRWCASGPRPQELQAARAVGGAAP